MTSLRVAMIAGTLSIGGAEKQFVYMVQALRDLGVEVKVYSLTKHGFYEAVLNSVGIPIQWVGKQDSRILRLGSIASHIHSFGAHIVQAGHFYVNIYAGIGARFNKAVGIGAMRSSGIRELKNAGIWGQLQVKSPNYLLCNSYAARRNLISNGIASKRVHTLPNVLDFSEFDQLSAVTTDLEVPPNRIVVTLVARLETVKHIERFLIALSEAQKSCGTLHGLIVGDGPERIKLETLAGELRLSNEDVQFLGTRFDVPAILRQSDMLVLTSEHEGFPNVIMEAMAARLPVITTPAGDTDILVKNGKTGVIVPFHDTQLLASTIVQFARNIDLRKSYGLAGRALIETSYGHNTLGERLLSIYLSMSQSQKTQADRRLYRALHSYYGDS